MTEPLVFEIGYRPDGSIMVAEETSVAGVFRGRVKTTMEKWLMEKVISPQQYEAASIFAVDHYDARQGAHYAVGGMERVDRGVSQNEPERYVRARKRLTEVYGSVGRQNFGVVSSIIGDEMSISEYARRQRWANKNMNDSIAKGMLLAALDVVVMVYARMGLLTA